MKRRLIKILLALGIAICLANLTGWYLCSQHLRHEYFIAYVIGSVPGIPANVGTIDWTLDGEMTRWKRNDIELIIGRADQGGVVRIVNYIHNGYSWDTRNGWFPHLNRLSNWLQHDDEKVE